MAEARHTFPLPSDDTEYLDNAFPGWEALEGGWVLLPCFPIPSGFTTTSTMAAIQIPPLYPASPLDMVYFYPAVLRTDGQPIAATNCTQMIDGKSFQRWSRHYQSSEWQPNEDSIATHVMAIRGWLEKAQPAGAQP